jgi:MoaA/NifB/PqqE/SkfB family radical SAM enzyme
MDEFNGKLDVQIGVTDFCNLSCIMCQQSAYRGVYGDAKKKAPYLHEGKRGFMTLDTMKNFIDSLIERKFKLRILSLMWIGESTIHPQFSEILELIFEHHNGVKRFQRAHIFKCHLRFDK